MEKIEKQIKDTNASYRDISAGDAKNTDLFLDGELRPFFGPKKNIQVRLHKQNLAQSILFIASILPRKYDCSSIHKKISYSSDFVIDNLNKLDGFFEGKSEKIVSWVIRQGTEQKNGKIDERFYLNNLIQEYSYTTKNGSIAKAKFTIRDYLAGGYSRIEFIDKDVDYYDFYVYNSIEKQADDGTEDDFLDSESSEKVYNRILFGAPGTGKSFILKEESKKFDKQEISAEDKLPNENAIKAEVKAALTQRGRKLNLLNAIGFKYAEFWKTKDKRDIGIFCGNEKIDEIYVGAAARTIVEDVLNKLEDPEDFDEEYIKGLIQDKDKRGENEVLKWVNAIGYKYGNTEVLTEKTREKLTSYFGLSTPQTYWLYRGIQAAHINVDESDDEADDSFVERVTFHPNYSYAQFVGTYKPVAKQTDSDVGADSISYEYIPGPFMRIYKKAIKNPNKEYLLIIEEINRANVAAVFGDVFQLLDRDSKGESEYPVDTSKDVRDYLQRKGVLEYNKLKIPSNMFIWATMNSADQGVFPMDTAFKRRWEFEYIGIDDNAKKVANYEIPIGRQGDKAKWKVKWDELRRSINDKLISLGINEDKLLGPYFLSESVLESAMDKGIDFVKSFESKVLMYLFEDAAKMKVRQLFKITSEKYIYSEVCKEFEEKGVEVFALEKYPNVVDIASSES